MGHAEEQLSWLQGKILTLLQSEDRQDILTEVNAALGACNTLQLQYFAQNISFEPLFDALNSSNLEEIEAAANATTTLLQHLEPQHVLNRFGNFLLRALKHPSNEVKRKFIICLKEKQNEETINILTNNCFAIYSTILDFIRTDTPVAQAAVMFIKALGQSEAGRRLIFSQPSIHLLFEIIKENDEVRFRVYDLIIHVSLQSTHGLTLSHQSGLLPLILTDIKTDDPLIQLNVLELLTLLVETQHGFTYLLEQQVIQFLCQKIINVHNEPLSNLVLPGLILFFGNLIKLNPNYVSQQYPAILDILFASLDSVDPPLIPVLISTVAHIASTNEGKILLQQQPQLMQKYLNKVALVIQTDNPARLPTLKALPAIFNVNQTDNNVSILNTITLTWFTMLGNDFTSKLMSIVKLPFIEQRLVVFDVLSTLVKQPWGLSKLILYPGLAEYLLDRSTEADNDCRHLKFDLIRNILEVDNAANILGTPSYLKLKEFVKEGVYYVQADPELAFEGAN